jgi:hypothetical protein
MKLFYASVEEANSANDMRRQMAIQQGYVPATCILAGMVIMNEIGEHNDHCAGCYLDRAICHGRPQQQTERTA